jgi:DNA replication protein DnaC
MWTLVGIGLLLSLASQELGSEWSSSTSFQRVRNFIIRFTRNQRKIYQDHVIERYQQFDVRGIAERSRQELGIQDVYVQLRVISADIADPETDSFVVDRRILDGDYSIWDILGHNTVNHMVIIGAPGSGKTTLLQHISLALCDPKSAPPTSNRPIPIFLFLGSHVSTIKSNPQISLMELVQDSLRRQVYAGKTEWIITQLRKGNCLILLDGLDEVADSNSRLTVVEWIYHQLNDKQYHNNRFIITSRSHGYQANILPPDLVTVFEVQPFNDDQIRNFIRNWYIEDERLRINENRDLKEIQNNVAADIKDLINKIYKTPALHDLAANPLLLMMMATVHRYSGTLPKRRADLYAKICDVFLGKLDRLKQHRHPLRATTEIDDLNINPKLERDEKRDILETVAYHMMSHEVNTLPIGELLELIDYRLQEFDPNVDSNQFLTAIEQRGGILMQVDADTYGFVHLTFQEYLASLHIAKHGLERNFPAWVDSAWWHETLRLYSTHTEIRNVLRACFAGNPPSTLALTLALECAEEATEKGVSQKVTEMLDKWANNVDPKLRKVVGEVKLTVRLNHLNRRDATHDPFQDVFVDQSLVTHVEYQLFLNEQRRQQNYHHPEHWINFDYRLGQGDTSLMGIRPSDAKAFCRWLTRWSKSTDSIYRLPNGGEFRNLPVKGTYWVDDAGEFKCGGVNGETPQLTPQQLYRFISLDIAPLVALEVDYTYKLIAELNNQLERSLNEGLDHRAGAITKALNVTLMQLRARAHLVPDLNRYLLTSIKQQLGELLQETRRHFNTRGVSHEQRQQALHRARRMAPQTAAQLKTLREASLQRAQSTLPDTAVNEIISAAVNADPQYIQLRSKQYPTSHDIAEPFALSLVDDFVGIFDLGTDRLQDLDRAMTTLFDTYMRHEILKHLSALVKGERFTINPHINLDRVYQLHDDLQIAYWKVKDLNLRSQQDKNLARELAERLGLARMLADYIFMGLDLARRSDDLNYRKFGHWTSRVLTLHIIGLLEIDAYQHLYQNTASHRSSNLTLVLLLQGFMQLYADLVVLEMRTHGNLAPVEGILIVKDKTLRH